MSESFKEYMQSIVKGPLLAKTIHQSIKEGSESLDLDGNRRALWKKLCDEIGEDKANKQVMRWISSPRPLK